MLGWGKFTNWNQIKKWIKRNEAKTLTIALLFAVGTGALVGKLFSEATVDESFAENMLNALP